VAESQNRWPSLGCDVLSLNNLIARFLPAGFYYKTFMAPGWAWERLYEPLIRRAAGLGRLEPLVGDRAAPAETCTITPMCWWSARALRGSPPCMFSARAA